MTADELAELQTLSASIEAAYQEAITNFETEAAQFEQDAVAAGNALSPEVKQLIQGRHAEHWTILKAVTHKPSRN